MRRSPTTTRPRLLPAGLILLLGISACQAGSSGSGVASASPRVTTIAAESAATAVEQMEGGFDCAPPVRRSDDFSWICEGSRAPVTATVHLYAREPQGALFGMTLYASAPSSQAEDEAARATEDLALDLVESTVPQDWREAAAAWISEHMPEGGRTLDVPDAGITASVQPLAALQWYIELYELDGREDTAPQG